MPTPLSLIWTWKSSTCSLSPCEALEKNSPLSSDFCLSYLLTVICPKYHCGENFANDLGLLTFDFFGQFYRWYARNSDINTQTWTIHAITSNKKEHIWVWVAHCYMNSKKNQLKNFPAPFAPHAHTADLHMLKAFLGQLGPSIPGLGGRESQCHPPKK